jgi:hypothetical protein
MDTTEDQVTIERIHREYEEMFRTQGWKNLLKDLTNNAIQINSVDACKDLKELHFRKGQLSIIANVLSLEQSLKTAKEQDEQEEIESLEEEDTEVSKSIN